jgi:pSer/pThr/pTyr-binding forkhead associated (FHA) protein
MTATIFLTLRILLSIFLYIFILVLFYFLWKENKEKGTWLSTRKIPYITLTIRGIDSPDHSLYFAIEEVIVGRDLSCDCRLDDENVSNHHARLKYHHAQWWLEDLGSKNGTFLNNQPLSTPVVVISGDEINCGKHTLLITISGEILNRSNNEHSTFEDGEDNE